MVISRQDILIWCSIFIVYLSANIILSGFYQTIPLIALYFKTINWAKLSLSIFLSLSIGALVATTVTLVVIHSRKRKHCREGTILAAIGAAGGLGVGVCPLCVTGLLPLLLSLIGVSFTFAALPLQGVEIQLLLIIVLAASIYVLKLKIHKT